MLHYLELHLNSKSNEERAAELNSGCLDYLDSIYLSGVPSRYGLAMILERVKSLMGIRVFVTRNERVFKKIF